MLIWVDNRVSRFAISVRTSAISVRTSAISVRCWARISAMPALNWSEVTCSPCSTASRRASVRASAWAGVKSAAVSDRATACVSSIRSDSPTIPAWASVRLSRVRTPAAGRRRARPGRRHRRPRGARRSGSRPGPRGDRLARPGIPPAGSGTRPGPRPTAPAAAAAGPPGAPAAA